MYCLGDLEQCSDSSARAMCHVGGSIIRDAHIFVLLAFVSVCFYSPGGGSPPSPTLRTAALTMQHSAILLHFKAAIDQLTRCAALDLSEHGVRCIRTPSPAGFPSLLSIPVLSARTCMRADTMFVAMLHA